MENLVKGKKMAMGNFDLKMGSFTEGNLSKIDEVGKEFVFLIFLFLKVGILFQKPILGIGKMTASMGWVLI